MGDTMRNTFNLVGDYVTGAITKILLGLGWTKTVLEVMVGNLSVEALATASTAIAPRSILSEIVLHLAAIGFVVALEHYQHIQREALSKFSIWNWKKWSPRLILFGIDLWSRSHVMNSSYRFLIRFLMTEPGEPANIAHARREAARTEPPTPPPELKQEREREARRKADLTQVIDKPMPDPVVETLPPEEFAPPVSLIMAEFDHAQLEQRLGQVILLPRF